MIKNYVKLGLNKSDGEVEYCKKNYDAELDKVYAELDKKDLTDKIFGKEIEELYRFLQKNARLIKDMATSKIADINFSRILTDISQMQYKEIVEGLQNDMYEYNDAHKSTLRINRKEKYLAKQNKLNQDIEKEDI